MSILKIHFSIFYVGHIYIGTPVLGNYTHACIYGPDPCELMYECGARVTVVQDSRGHVEAALVAQAGRVVRPDPTIYAHGVRVYEVALEHRPCRWNWYFNEFNLARAP